MAFRNPPAFVATGKGYFNKLPNNPATSVTGNCRLWNRAKAAGDRNSQIWLYVTEFSTGWQIAGDYGQSASARTFYPMNVSQDLVTLTGIVPNQYEYDRIVEFTRAHHDTATDILHPTDDTGSRPIQIALTPYTIFVRDKFGKLFQKTIHPGSMFEGYITTIDAGHERFVNAPTYQLQIKAANDLLEQKIENQNYLNQTLKKNYITTFGQLYKQPAPGKLNGQQSPDFSVVNADSGSFWDYTNSGTGSVAPGAPSGGILP